MPKLEMALQFQLCLLYQAASLLSHIVMFVFLTSQAQLPTHHSKPQHPKPPKPQHTPRHRVLSYLQPHLPCISAFWWAGHTLQLWPSFVRRRKGTFGQRQVTTSASSTDPEAAQSLQLCTQLLILSRVFVSRGSYS